MLGHLWLRSLESRHSDPLGRAVRLGSDAVGVAVSGLNSPKRQAIRPVVPVAAKAKAKKRVASRRGIPAASHAGTSSVAEVSATVTPAPPTVAPKAPLKSSTSGTTKDGPAATPSATPEPKPAP